MNIADDRVHGVISLYRLVYSWVWRSLTLTIFLVLINFISPLIIALLLRWLIFLIIIFIILSLILILSWWKMLNLKMMVDLELVEALRISYDTHPQWTYYLVRHMEPLHHLVHQDQLAPLGSH
jgi:hypothetical protein